MRAAVKILVVDDAPTVRYALAALLRTAGYEVIEAVDAAQAVHAAAAALPDLVVADLHLPGLRNRVRYAQLLNDGSEVKTFDFTQHHRYPSGGEDLLTLELPIQKPSVHTPVVELFLAD